MNEPEAPRTPLDLSIGEFGRQLMRSHDEMNERNHDPEDPDAPALLVRTWLFSIVKGVGIRTLWHLSHRELKERLVQIWLDNTPAGNSIDEFDAAGIVDHLKSGIREPINSEMRQVLRSLVSLHNAHYGPLTTVSLEADSAIVDIRDRSVRPQPGTVRFTLARDRSVTEGNPWRVRTVSALDDPLEFREEPGY